jgi:hypothetical protein
LGTKFALIFYLFLYALSVSAQPVDLTLIEEYSFGEFQRATRVVFGLQGTIYVLDADQNKLTVFTNIQDAPMSFGGFGWSAGSFDNPTGLATDGINIYVSDYGNHRIQRFDRKLNYISSISTRDTSDTASRFGYPLDVALSELGDMFVLDGENLRILKYDPLYHFELTFGNINSGKGKLQYPIKLIATNSRIYVGERNRIVMFDYFGNYLGSVGDGLISEVNGFTIMTNGILAASSDTIWWFLQDGKLQKSLSLSMLFSGERIDRIQDITYNANRLFVLSPRKLHVFRINN